MKSIKELRIERLLKMIEIAGSQAKLSELSGISESQISQMKNKEHPRAIGDKAANKLELALGLPLNWMDANEAHVEVNSETQEFINTLSMATGQDNKTIIKNIFLRGLKDPKFMAKNESHEFLGHIDAWDSNTDLDEDEAELPFFMEVELAAGMGSNLTQESYGPKLRFSKSTLKRCGVDPANAVCVKVSGDSMEPRLFNGDVVGVDLGNKRIVDGKTYAINHDGLLRIKRLYLLPSGGLRINSFNLDDYQDEVLNSEDRGLVSVIGRVFWSSSIWG